MRLFGNVKLGKNSMDKDIIIYIHGIGKSNDTIDVCDKLQKKTGIETIPFSWSDLFDTYEKEFVHVYSDNMCRIREWSVYYVGDIIIYEKMKSLLFNKLTDLFSELTDRNINIVTHSLGGVIISDFLYDNPNINITNMFTIGCPLALYSLRYGTNNFNKPINNVSNWINIWNEYDAISYPLKKLNKEYDFVVRKDINISIGNIIERILKIAHGKYFDNEKTYKIIKENWI